MRLLPCSLRVYIGAWTLLALYNITHDILVADPKAVLLFSAAHFGLWALLGFVAIPLVRRWPLTRSPASWLRQVALGAAFTMVDITAGHWIGFQLLHIDWATRMSLAELAVFAFKGCFHMGLINYFMMVAFVQALDALWRERTSLAREATLRSAWVEARLRQLRSQLHPHFLFNALHTVGALMHRDLGAAERVLDRLAHLLRLSLRETEQDVVELRTELAFVEAYCEIEKTRFEHRLDVELAVPATLQGAAIPPLILQPLVENAIKHGVSPHPQGGRVVVRAWQEDGSLVLEVENAAQGTPRAPADIGVAPPTPPRPGLGLALDNIRTRLQALYGNASALELLHGDAGAIARIRLPWSATATA